MTPLSLSPLTRLNTLLPFLENEESFRTLLGSEFIKKLEEQDLFFKNYREVLQTCLLEGKKSAVKKVRKITFLEQPLPSSLSWGIADSLFGSALLVFTNEALVELSFPSQPQNKNALIADLQKKYPEKDLSFAPKLAEAWASKAFGSGSDFILNPEGTEFQRGVWKQLCTIPRNERRSYKEISYEINKPQAIRAVGTAVGRNNLGYLIPCHLVFGEDKSFRGYRWGLERKLQMFVYDLIRT